MSRGEGDLHGIYSFIFLFMMSCGIFLAIKESNDVSVKADVLPDLVKSSLPPLPEEELTEGFEAPRPNSTMEFKYEEELSKDTAIYRIEKRKGYYGGGSRAAQSYGLRNFLRRNK